MPKSEKLNSGKEPAKSRRVAPRDRYESTPLSPEERATLLEARAREAALYKNPDPQSGFDLAIRVFSAAPGKSEEGADEIHITIKVEGTLLRPGLETHAKGVTQTIRVPAIIVTEGVAE